MTMLDHEQPSPEAGRWWLRRWKESWDQPSETARHYYHVLLATIMFFLSQVITCAWDQPFWVHGLDFPGQIVSMVFVWLAMWAAQAALSKPGQGLDRLYSQYLRAPVSFVTIQKPHESLTSGHLANAWLFPTQTEILNKHMSIGFTVPFLNLISKPFAGMEQVGILTAAFGTSP